MEQWLITTLNRLRRGLRDDVDLKACDWWLGFAAKGLRVEPEAEKEPRDRKEYMRSYMKDWRRGKRRKKSEEMG
jgi:hypothetical protein